MQPITSVIARFFAEKHPLIQPVSFIVMPQ
jgi:hypothetical protein